ncbi:hypothetical protein ACFV0T_12960 [Streptomyces sp. NPDC059582]|uniref:hypothetical protein n=1 Tax=Streptomyces sp. NPDC059582 TaxID=3346875 RepID=UPI0036A5A455
MAVVQARTELISRVRSAINTVMAGATVMDLPSVVSSDAVAITAFDESDTRSSDALTDAFIAQLRSDGWAVDERERTRSEPQFHAAKAGLGGGAFAVRTAAVSFHGLANHDTEAGPRP